MFSKQAWWLACISPTKMADVAYVGRIAMYVFETKLGRSDRLFIRPGSEVGWLDYASVSPG